jgi:hypothetical protein
VLTAGPTNACIVETDVTVETLTDGQVVGYAAAREGSLALERDGRKTRLAAKAGAPVDALVLDGEWEFAPESPNALVIGSWMVAAETPEVDWAAYSAPEAGTSGWLPMVPGAWSYQLPAEPARPYPIDVWYRASFHAGHLPSQMDLIVDGFAGSAWRLFVNGKAVTTTPVRSSFDSQMQAVGIANWVQEGENVVAIRLTVASPTDGLLDLLKLVGDFSLKRGRNGAYTIAAPRRVVQPTFWTTQGYPFLSGRAVYRRRFQLPDEFAGQHIFLEPVMSDDVLEVLINGQSAGVRLWEPYAVQVTEFLHPGENVLELRVANTLANLLKGVERPSGLAGAPELRPYRRFTFDLRAQE